MHLALTNCPDTLIRELASSLPRREVTLGALPPGDPLVDGSAGAELPFDAVLTAPCSGSGDCGHVRWLRSHYPHLPILVVTGTDDPDLVVAAFEAGADVVLKGPLDTEELRVRARTLARRDAVSEEEELLRYGRLRLNRLRHAAEGPSGSVHLTPREYQILQHVMARPERVVSRSELARAVWWNDDEPPAGNLLDVHVSHLRSKLEEAGAEGLLHTVRGVGFIFGDPEEQEAAARPA